MKHRETKERFDFDEHFNRVVKTQDRIVKFASVGIVVGVIASLASTVGLVYLGYLAVMYFKANS